MKVFSLNSCTRRQSSFSPSTMHRHQGTFETRRSFQKEQGVHATTKFERKNRQGWIVRQELRTILLWPLTASSPLVLHFTLRLPTSASTRSPVRSELHHTHNLKKNCKCPRLIWSLIPSNDFQRAISSASAGSTKACSTARCKRRSWLTVSGTSPMFSAVPCCTRSRGTNVTASMTFCGRLRRILNLFGSASFHSFLLDHSHRLNGSNTKNTVRPPVPCPKENQAETGSNVFGSTPVPMDHRCA